MSDVADCKNIADYAVAVAVDCIDVLLDVLLNHSSLKLSTLVCIKSYIVCSVVEAEGVHVQFSSGAVGWLTVEPY